MTTARASYRLSVRIKGRDIPVYGEGFTDFSRGIESYQLTIEDRQVERVSVGCDTFTKLPEERQKATGKIWLWESRCPHGDFWKQILAGARQIASWTGGDAEIVSGERVRRYSQEIRPRRSEKIPVLAELYAHLRSHGRDRLMLDVWLADDHSLRRYREHSDAPELALLDGKTNVAAETREYWDFGVRADFTVPTPDQVLGAPG